MGINTDRMKRIGGVILEVGLGVFLITVLVSALKTPESQANSVKSAATAKAKGASLATETLLPLGGTTCSLTCPQNITAVAAASCPFAIGTVVTYPAPTTNGSCGTVTCTPPSGSSFPVGSTTVTCTAASSYQEALTYGESCVASCGFTVTVFGMCLQDDSNSANVVLFNPLTGEYRFCCNGVVIASGTGTTSIKGCIVEIQHNPGGLRVLIKADTTVKKGTASLQKGPGASSCVIYDRNMANNTCMCGVPPPPPGD